MTISQKLLADTTGAQGFYVSVISGQRRQVLYGPLAGHQEVLDLVEPVRRVTVRHNPRAHFMAFGTARVQAHEGQCLPPGRLNDLMSGEGGL